MSTRSFIAMKLPPDMVETYGGPFVGIYCHWGGYPAGVGRTLITSYPKDTDAAQLIAGGSLSSLGASIGEKHSFDDPPEGQCTYYVRDRGEKWASNAPLVFVDFAQLCRYAEKSWVEYLYVWDGVWCVAEKKFDRQAKTSSFGDLRLVDAVLEEEEALAWREQKIGQGVSCPSEGQG